MSMFDRDGNLTADALPALSKAYSPTQWSVYYRMQEIYSLWSIDPDVMDWEIDWKTGKSVLLPPVGYGGLTFEEFIDKAGLREECEELQRMMDVRYTPPGIVTATFYSLRSESI